LRESRLRANLTAHAYLEKRVMIVFSALLLFLLPSFVVSLSYHERGEAKTVPLKALAVTGDFFDCLGEVIVKQTWVNDAPAPITSNYKFSLDGQAVISGFLMSVGEKKWVGVVKEKNKAQQQFNDAVSAGVKSSLLEKISDNDYQVQIGPIGANETATIEFRYLTRVSVKKDGSYHFVLPTNIASKYLPSTSNQVDAEYARKMGTIPYANQPAYKFEVDLTWRSGSALQEIVSPTNVIRTEVLSARMVRVQCSTAPANGDFSLLVRTAQSTGAYFYNRDDGTQYLYVHNQIPAEKTTPTPKTITLVLDRSGSMGGNKIVQALKAVDGFLSLLKEENSTLVNIVSFGSHHSALYSHPVPATAGNIAQMRHLVRSSGADFGDTELLDCLTEVVRGQYTSFDTRTADHVKGDVAREHVVVLLTDGQVSSRSAITEMLTKNAKGVRIMTIGIGRDADRELVQGVADATYGISRVLVDELDLTAALQEVLGYIDKQYYTDVRLLGHEVTQVSRVLYPAHPVDLFLRLDDAQMLAAERDGLSVTATDPVRGGAKVWPIAVKDCEQVGDLLEKLYANHVINELSKKVDQHVWPTPAAVVGEELNMIVKLSVAHGIMNKRTSFLVISDDKIDPADLSAVRNVEVPHHASVGGMTLLSTGEAPGGNSGSVFIGSGAAYSAGTGGVVLMARGPAEFGTSADQSGGSGGGASLLTRITESAQQDGATPDGLYIRTSGSGGRLGHLYLTSGSIPTVSGANAGPATGRPAHTGGKIHVTRGGRSDRTGHIYTTMGTDHTTDIGNGALYASSDSDSTPHCANDDRVPHGDHGDTSVHGGTRPNDTPQANPSADDVVTSAGWIGVIYSCPVGPEDTNLPPAGSPGSFICPTPWAPRTPEQRIVELAMHHSVPLPYDASSYQLLQYANQAALEEDAARAALSADMFLNTMCLLRLRRAALPGKDWTLALLEAYVNRALADLKVNEVAAILGL
jgi:Ca-activated chloride channel family protein